MTPGHEPDVDVWSDRAGTGPAVVFLHGGLGDHRIWHPQWSALQAHTRIRIDLPGFGNTPPATGPHVLADLVIGVLDRYRIETAVLIGTSLGARVALELAVARPHRVTALALFAPGITGFGWSADVVELDDHLGRLSADAQHDAAIDATVDFWLKGSDRGKDELDAQLVDLVRTMLRGHLEHRSTVPDRPLVPDLLDRVTDIACPSMLAVGDHDHPDMHTIANLLHTRIAGSTLHEVSRAAHLPTLEQPEQCNQLLRTFLRDRCSSTPAAADLADE